MTYVENLEGPGGVKVGLTSPIHMVNCDVYSKSGWLRLPSRFPTQTKRRTRIGTGSRS